MVFGKNVTHYYFKYFHLLLIGIIALIFVDYIQLLIPENYGYLIDLIKDKTLTNDLLMKIVLDMTFIALGMFVGRFAWRITVLNMGVNVETDLRKKMFLHMESLAQEYFQQHKTGAQMALYTNDIMAIKNCFTDGVIMAIDALFLGGLAIYKMIRLNALMTIVASVPLLIIGLCGGILGKMIDRKFERRQKSYERLSEFAQENFSGIAVIKAFVKEQLEYLEFAKLNREYSKHNIAFTKLILVMNVMFAALINIIIVIVIGYGTYLIQSTAGTEHPFTSGDLVVFISYFGSLTWPALALANLINIIAQGRTSLRRINELLNYPVTVTDDADVVWDAQVEGDIAFQNLTFTYPGVEQPVLKEVSFVIQKGEKVGIIGKTGCGKTTIADLLVRMYNVEPSMITIGGRDIMQLPIQKVRDSIAYVPQDNFLFNQSVLENIAFSRKYMSKEEAAHFAHFAQLAHVDDNIREFKDGYDTIIGERGVTLSGGQKQRISMARAMAKTANILILDDAVSAVDTKTEAGILKTLKTEFVDKTIILIAHRVSTIQHLDKILLLDEGQVVAYGTHDELYRSTPMYRDIVELQKLEEGDQE
ncbi:MAG: ABC transporter ATP-binding protein/permease [Prevotella sp.]|nr:ABC transporter ATP-binding protein/permease [Staphylococcus sp.]MCM1349728.1 ABC transporter ATP-binding protein/permease [Prevotella sp.]